MRQLSQVFKALSEATRLEILTLLFRHGELCVCDTEAVLGVTQSKASRHLRYLYGAGLVEHRREGLWVHYFLTRSPTSEQRIILDAVQALLTDDRASALETRYARWMALKPTCQISRKAS